MLSAASRFLAVAFDAGKANADQVYNGDKQAFANAFLPCIMVSTSSPLCRPLYCSYPKAGWWLFTENSDFVNLCLENTLALLNNGLAQVLTRGYLFS